MTQENINIDQILQAVSKTECLGSSLRQYNLLKYLLTEQYEGRGKRIKAYSIAIDVLGRDESFDNSVDSIVRVEMHRLRKSLALFNELSDEFALHIPKATYFVNVMSHSTPQRGEFVRKVVHDDRSLREKGRLSLFILVVLVLGALGVLLYIYNLDAAKNSVAASKCPTATPNLIVMPTRVVGLPKLQKDVKTTIDSYLRTGVAQYSMVNMVSESGQCNGLASPLYKLTAEIFNAVDQSYVLILVENVESRQIIFTEKIKFEAQERVLPEHIEWTFYRVASKLLHESGVIPRDAIARVWSDKPSKRDYLCQVLAYKYTTVHLPGYNYKESVECMEHAIAQGSQNANLYGMLAAFYFDQERGYQPTYIENPYEKAVDLLDRAEIIEPYNTNVLLARLRWVRLKREHSKEKLKHLVLTIENQQPYNPNVLRITALVSGFAIGDWEHAKRVSETALKLDLTNSNQYYYISTAYALLYSPPDDAYQLSLKLYEPNSKVALLLCLASAKKAMENEKIALYKRHLAVLGLRQASDYVAYVNSRDYEPKIHAELMKWIRTSAD